MDTTNIFGEDLQYLASVNVSTGMIGRMFVLIVPNSNPSARPFEGKKAQVTQVFWLDRVLNETFNESMFEEHLSLPPQCTESSGHVVDVSTPQPTRSPTAHESSKSCNNIPEGMVFVYALLVAFFVIALFAWVFVKMWNRKGNVRNSFHGRFGRKGTMDNEQLLPAQDRSENLTDHEDDADTQAHEMQGYPDPDPHP